ncbi:MULTISPECIES: MEDS domain-containing protein [Amycolatopsis]|uniref:Uncharacterized protein n=1 Tax=Amycolatopsis bullii TaxID=941987 RepID=A0ABQ3KIH9_9PSEU|nr:MEDS domain-containing protein [Amycolatopsis bullii]GHG12437.1 hypothetical protein GCM10017567_32360 [Amycolatopsis bullii]
MPIPTEREGRPFAPARDHVCRGYRRRGDFVAQAQEFLAEGLAAGERVLYVAPGDEAALTGQLRADERCDEGLERGAVQVASVDEAYPTGAVVDPAGQVDLYAAATSEALAAGFTGLRVAADATSLVRTPAQVDAFARYEHGGHHTNTGYVDPLSFLADPRPMTPLLIESTVPRAELADPRPSDARRAVLATAPLDLPADEVDDLVLAVSEIVDNALRHGRPPVRVRIWAGAGQMVVSVHDAGAGPADPFAGLLPADRSIGGRGLWIAHQICSQVTLHRHETGFTARLAAGRPW